MGRGLRRERGVGPFGALILTMNLVFTQYVRSLVPGEAPSPEAFEAVWEKLRQALRKEMQVRSLWQAPPRYLGIFGGSGWYEPSTFDELLSDCYVFVFVRRLGGLATLLESRDNIEGVVFLNIRHFLFERQKKHDPLGYRVYSVVHEAVRQAIAGGRLLVVEGPAKVVNDTLLALGLVSSEETKSRPEASAELESLLGGFTHDLLPELVVAQRPTLDRIIATLADRIVALLERGLRLFRFKSLVDPLKRQVRRQWSAIWEESQGEAAWEPDGEGSAQWIRLVQPEADFEAREHFEALIECVAASLRKLDAPPRTREYLERLWLFLRQRLAEEAPPLPHTQMARLLEIPRYRLASLHQRLGDLVHHCQGPQENFRGS